MTTPTRTPQQVLLAAARIMRRNGKANGRMRDSKGRVCAIEAIRLASGGEVFNSKVGVRALKMLRGHAHCGDIGHWSDSNTAATVIAALRRAGGA